MVDAGGSLALVRGTRPPETPDEQARRLCGELGELLGRPIELLSVRANPLGSKVLVTVATREIGAVTSPMCSAAASGLTVEAALLDALVAAHLPAEALVPGALRRLVEDGVVTAAVLVTDGVERTFGHAGPPTAPPRPTRDPTAAGPGGHPVRMLELGPLMLAVTPDGDRGAALFDLWWAAFSRRTTAVQIGFNR